MPTPPTTLQDHVTQLRELLRTSNEFIVPWAYFHDELAMDPDFPSLGKRATSPLIDATIKQIAKTRGWSLQNGNALTVHIPEFALWHGFRSHGGRTGIFFYDEHGCRGLLGVMSDLNGPVDFFRLSTVAFPA